MHLQVAEEAVARAAEREIGHRRGDADIDANHRRSRPTREFPRRFSAGREDRCRVRVGVRLHQRDRLVEVLHGVNRGDRTKNFFVADLHLRRHLVEDGWAQEEALVAPFNRDASSIEHELRAFPDALIDVLLYAIAVGAADDRSHFDAWLQPVAEWNPTSTLTASLRELWGNPNPYASTAFPSQYPVLVTVAWFVVIELIRRTV